ncbi:T-complex protein 1 subunit zeta [Purpureocillium lavendulum]|uniref:T-complex protein 1 subunit zeta n=1 Tax=Purpureocillium lavendulum TaxID=1247861 RepID=A0AB34FRT0_9HYPO|nr:T-complex protein 1 subunit zeta [Purpureocillium lavendulum]
MDFVKKAAEGLKGSSGEKKDQPAQGGDGQKEDYVDKAFGFASSKSGHTLSREQQEKITDGGRSAYEKATGSKVDPKISN